MCQCADNLDVTVERYPSPALALVRRRFGSSGLLAAFGCALVLFARSLGGDEGYLSMLGGGAAIAIALSFVPAGLHALLGHFGEKRVEAALGTLGDEYRLLCNFSPPGKVGDADRVLIGPDGVLVMEVKTYTRPVRVRGADWWVQHSSGQWRRINSPWAQLRRVVAALGETLGSPVSCIVVVSNGMELDVTSSPVPIVRVGELAEFVGRKTQQLSSILALKSRVAALKPELELRV